MPIFKLPKIIVIIAVLCLFSIIFVFNPSIFDELKRFKNFTPADIFIISLLFISAQIIQGLEIKILCHPFGVKLNLYEWFGLVSMRSYGNYLPFNAGIMAIAVLLKKNKGLPITKFAAIATFMMVTMYGMTAFIGCTILLYFLAVGRYFSVQLISVFGTIFFIAGLVLLTPVPNLKGNNRIIGWIGSIRMGFQTIKSDMQVFILLILLRLLLLGLVSFRLWFLIRNLGYTPDTGTIILLTCGITTLGIGSLLPGNLGLREAVAGWISLSTGISFEYGFIAISADRIIQIVWILIFGLVFSYYFGRTLTVSST